MLIFESLLDGARNSMYATMWARKQVYVEMLFIRTIAAVFLGENSQSIRAIDGILFQTLDCVKTNTQEKNIIDEGTCSRAISMAFNALFINWEQKGLNSKFD